MRLWFTQTHQNWTLEDRKNIAWFKGVSFSPVTFRLSAWKLGSILSWINGPGWSGGGCVMVWGIYSCHSLGPFSTNWALFKSHSQAECCCWPFMTTLYPSSNGYFQQHNVPKPRSLWSGSWNMRMTTALQRCLHYLISFQKRTFGILWNRLAS